MADILFVCVREDLAQAETLAEIFDEAGFSVDDAADSHALRACGAGVIVWSAAASGSSAFAAAAQRLARSGKGVIASLDGAAPHDGTLPVFDLTDWDGEAESAVLDAMFFAIDRMVIAARGAEIAANARASKRKTRVIDLDQRPAELAVADPRTARRELPVALPTPQAGARRRSANTASAVILAAFAIAAMFGSGFYAHGARAERADLQDKYVGQRMSGLSITDLARAAPADDAVIEAPALAGRAGLEPPTAPSRV